MRKEVEEIRNLARRKKEDIKYKRIEFKKEGEPYYAILKGFGSKALKLEMFVSYDDLYDNKDKPLEKELLERMYGEYRYRPS